MIQRENTVHLKHTHMDTYMFFADMYVFYKRFYIFENTSLAWHDSCEHKKRKQIVEYEEKMIDVLL